MARQPSVTEQQTASGRRIEDTSLAQVDAEAGDRSGYSGPQWALVRRLIHTTADFDFNGLTRFHPEAVPAGLAAIRPGAPLFVDVEMIRAGLSTRRLDRFGVRATARMGDPAAAERARAQGGTRAEQAVALAAEAGELDGIVAVGNAPTALRAVLRRIEDGEAAPRLLIAMPVGFVAAAEATDEAMAQQRVPWIATAGRKGGSPPVVACLHALLRLAEEGEA